MLLFEPICISCIVLIKELKPGKKDQCLFEKFHIYFSLFSLGANHWNTRETDLSPRMILCSKKSIKVGEILYTLRSLMIYKVGWSQRLFCRLSMLHCYSCLSIFKNHPDYKQLIVAAKGFHATTFLLRSTYILFFQMAVYSFGNIEVNIL